MTLEQHETFGRRSEKPACVWKVPSGGTGPSFAVVTHQ